MVSGEASRNRRSSPTRASDLHHRAPIDECSLSSSIAFRRRSLASSMRPLEYISAAVLLVS